LLRASHGIAQGLAQSKEIFPTSEFGHLALLMQTPCLTPRLYLPLAPSLQRRGNAWQPNNSLPFVRGLWRKLATLCRQANSIAVLDPSELVSGRGRAPCPAENFEKEPAFLKHRLQRLSIGAHFDLVAEAQGHRDFVAVDEEGALAHLGVDDEALALGEDALADLEGPAGLGESSRTAY
jgi:hypothetical protein